MVVHDLWWRQVRRALVRHESIVLGLQDPEGEPVPVPLPRPGVQTGSGQVRRRTEASHPTPDAGGPRVPLQGRRARPVSRWNCCRTRGTVGLNRGSLPFVFPFYVMLR